MGQKTKKKAAQRAQASPGVQAPKGTKKAAVPDPALGQQDLSQFLATWSDEASGSEAETAVEVPAGGGRSSDSGMATGRYVQGLAQKDPEFYAFLRENDQELLQFDADDSSGDEGAQGLHQPPEALELASDESDFEPEDDPEAEGARKKKKSGKTKLTRKLLDQLELHLEKTPSVNHVQQLSLAFKAALLSLKPDGASLDTPYRVEGGAMFNAVIRSCLTHMTPALKAVLKIEGDPKPARLTKAKKWSALNKTLKGYTADLSLFLSALSESTVLCVMLKHIHPMIPYFAALPKSSKLLTTQLINLWSTGDDAVRILAFMCLIRLARTAPSSLLEPIIKSMYMAFVKNVKFTSPNTWPMINFMRRSLAEIFGLDPKVAYTHAFVYIRQLSISLRNALTVQKKESIQAVYNWQFVHSLHFWSHFLGVNCRNNALEPLVYPLVQVIKGAIKLVYVPKYHPLRFHLCTMLSSLSAESGKFIPILPYYLEILNTYNFNKKSSKVSMKPVDFSNILRISKSQMLENGTKDTTLDNVYMGMCEYLANQSHKIAFPELVYPATVQMRDFLKKCKVANHGKKIKQLLEKIDDNSQIIAQKRSNASFGLKDTDEIRNWEERVRTEGTALAKFFASMRKVKKEEKLKLATEQDKLDDYDFIPKVDKKRKKKGPKDEEEEFKGIFGGDQSDDSDLDDEERFQLKEERGKKRKTKEATASKKKQAKLEEEDEEQDEDEDLSSNESEDQAGEDDLLSDEADDEDDMDDEVEDFNVEDLDSEDEVKPKIKPE